MNAVAAARSVSRRPADLAFLAGTAPGSIRLLGSAAGARSAAEAMGWRVVDDGWSDLCICDAGSWRAALPGHPTSLVIAGGGVASRQLSRHGYAVRRAVAWPHAANPRGVATIDKGPLRQLFGLEPASVARRVAGSAACTVARLGVVPARARLTIADLMGARSPWPFQVGLGDGPAAWLMIRGEGDDLQRLIFLGYGAGEHVPAFAIKLARVPAGTDAFDRDQKGLALIATAGAGPAAHAPVLLSQGTVAGFPASVESAAPGRRLCDVLGGHQSLTARLRFVEAVASWTLDVGRATLGRLDEAATADLQSLAVRAGRLQLRVVRLPGVLVHGDLGTWNILASADTFTVVDWESARRPGLALADLVYFLADALTIVEDRRAGNDQVAAMLRLFRGEARLSSVLFSWIRRAAAQARVAAADVAAIVTLTWLHHATSPHRRGRALQASLSPAAADLAPHARLAEAWLADTKLGWGWDVWRH